MLTPFFNPIQLINLNVLIYILLLKLKNRNIYPNVLHIINFTFIRKTLPSFNLFTT